MSYIVLITFYPKNITELKSETSKDRKSRRTIKEK